MPRSISLAGLQALFAEQTGDAFLPLVTIEHATLDAPIRLVADQQDLSFEGQTYIALPFELTLPADTEEQVPEVKLAVDNVDREIVAAIRRISSPPTVTLEIVRVDVDGVITSELPPMAFRMNGSDYDALLVNATLGYEADYLNEPAVKDRFDPATAPGLF